MPLRPLFGTRASVTNVHDSFGTTVELVKSSESEHADPLQHQQYAGSSPPSNETPISSQSSSNTPAHEQHQASERQKQGGQSLAGFLNGAALVSPMDDHSQPEDHHHDSVSDLHSHAQPAIVRIPSSTAAWKESGNEAESSDQHESSRIRAKFGRTLKKVDAKIRTTLGVNAPPTADEMRSPYSIGTNDHVSSQNNLGAAELLNDASIETLQHLSDDDDDDDDEDVEDGDEDDDHDEDARTVHGHEEQQAKPDLDQMERDLEKLRKTKDDAERRRSGSMDGARPGDSVSTDAPVKIST